VFGLNSFNPTIFTIFDAWAQQQDPFGTAKRASIVRGQALFNTRRGPGINRPPFFDPTGTNCGECHNAAENGGSTVPVPTGQVHVGEEQFASADLPLYTLQCSATGIAKKACMAGQQIHTNDPGRALITGSWRSIDNFKVPGLRDLAARPPYFHDGSAATLGDVIDFYKNAMKFEFTDAEKQDLVNFLSAL
jgi:cytochrome c peroxidase